MAGAGNGSGGAGNGQGGPSFADRWAGSLGDAARENFTAGNFVGNMLIGAALGGGVGSAAASAYRAAGNSLADFGGNAIGNLLSGFVGSAATTDFSPSGGGLSAADGVAIGVTVVAGVVITALVGSAVLGASAAVAAAYTVGGLLGSSLIGTLAATAAGAYDAAAAAQDAAEQDAPDDQQSPEPGPPHGPLECPPISPLIIDLDGDGVETISLEDSTTYFDLDGDGLAERTGWVSADDALLVLDRNANGEIDNISELFGNGTQDGFSELAEEDTNGDGVIDAADTVFDQLRLWQDLNSDGIAQEDELTSLSDAGVVSFDLNAVEENYEVDAGNVSHSSTATFNDGSSAQVLDVWFNNIQNQTQSLEQVDISDAAYRLPFLAGSGQVSSLAEAMTFDSGLLLQVRELLINMPDQSSSEFRTAFEEMLIDWAGVENVTTDARGDYIDGQHLALLEAFYDYDYRQFSGTNAGTSSPGPNAGYVIELQYQELVDRYLTQFAAQSAYASFLLVGDLYTENGGVIHPFSESLEDSAPLTLGMLIYDRGLNRVSLVSAENAIQTVLDNIPDDQDLVLSYLDQTLSHLVGLRHDNFNGDVNAYQDWLRVQLSGLNDEALIEVSINIATGNELLMGDETDETIASNDEAPNFLVRQPVPITSIINGGEGNDQLEGGAGGDVYLINPGDGADTIFDDFFNGIGGFDAGRTVDTYGQQISDDRNPYLDSVDSIVFTGRNFADANFNVLGEDLVITFTDSLLDSVRITRFFEEVDLNSLDGEVAFSLFPTVNHYQIERFIFADQIVAAEDLFSTNSDETVPGTATDDLVLAGLGDDVLEGGLGSDSYVYSAGDGSDIINDTGSSGGDFNLGTFVGDRINFLDFQLDDINFDRQVTNVTISFDGVAGSLLLSNQGISNFRGVYTATAIEGVEFSNGQIIRIDTVGVALGNDLISDVFQFSFSASDDLDADGIVVGGFGNNDYFVGSAAAIIFDGLSGHDTYIVHNGDGLVIVRDTVVGFGQISNYQNDEDALILRDIVFEDLDFQRQNSDLVILQAGVEIIRVEQQFLENSTFGVERRDGVELIIDENLQTLNREEVAALTTHVGFDDNDTMSGIEYIRNDDTVYANSDTFIGGLGDDTLRGGNGSDTYTYTRNDGSDIILDISSDFRYDPGNDTDRLVLTDINFSDVILERVPLFQIPIFVSEMPHPDSYGLVITVISTGETITSANQFLIDDFGPSGPQTNELDGLEEIVFADGQVLDRAMIDDLAVIRGTVGDDNIEGRGLIDARSGDDQITGRSDNDTLIYAANDGNDVISGIEVISFTDINASDVTFTRLPNNALQILIVSTGESLISTGFFGFPGPIGPGPRPFPPEGANELREIQFADGDVWLVDEIRENAVLFIDPNSPSPQDIGTPDDDLIILGAGDQTFNGFLGDDTISGGLGADQLLGDEGNDTFVVTQGDAGDIINGGSGTDTIDARNITESLTFDLSAGTLTGETTSIVEITEVEQVVGGLVDDTINGNDLDNTLDGYRGDDVLNGMDGNDILIGGIGADTLDGGAGHDTVSYNRSLGGVDVSLVTGEGIGADAEGDQLTSIENIIGSNYSDVIEGDDSDNILTLNNGSDTANAGAGNDVIDAGAGNDSVSGEAGNDTIVGGSGADVLSGGEGFDVLQGGTGLDLLDGGDGADEYLWVKGDGTDYINDEGDAGDTDILRLNGVTVAEVSFFQNNNDLWVQMPNGERVVISAFYDGDGIEEIHLDGGVIIGRVQIVNETTILANQIAIANDDSNFIGQEDQTLTILATDLLVNDLDLDGDQLTITEFTNVVGGQVAFNADGDVVFTPEPDFNGDASFTYTVTDGEFTSDANVSITIEAVNDAPAIATLPQLVAQEDQPFSATLSSILFSDVDGDNITVAVSLSSGDPLPAWLSFEPDTGVLFGTPPLNFNGVLDLNVSVSDGIETTEQATSLTVESVNDAPVIATLPNFMGVEDQLFSSTLDNNLFTDVDGDTLSISVILNSGDPLPSWLSYDPVTGVLEGTPPANFNGTLDLLVSASDGALTTEATTSLVIEAVNDAPVIGILPELLGQEDQLFSVTISSDLFTDVDDDLLIVAVRLDTGEPLPSWLSFNADTGVLAGQPPVNFNGNLDLSVSVFDGSVTTERAAMLNIAAVDDAPVIGSLPNLTGKEDTFFTATFSNDLFVDIDTQNLTIAVALTSGDTLPAWLAFDPDTLTLEGTPPANFNGVLNLEISVSDDTTTVTEQTLLTIEAVNDAPTIGILPSYLAEANVAFSAALPDTLFEDVDGDALTVSINLSSGDPLPDWLAFDADTLIISGTPPAGFNGDLDLEVSVTDGSLITAAQTVLTVEGNTENQAPIANDDAFSIDVLDDLSFDQSVLLANDTDPEGDTLEIVGVTDSQNGNVEFVNGRINYAANFDFEGNDQFTYTISDGETESTATVTVTVSNDYDVSYEGDDSSEVVIGTRQDDLIATAGGNDIVFGRKGNDALIGGSGNDILFGGRGNDIIQGGEGNDYLFGGRGQDTFVYETGDGQDTVFRFETPRARRRSFIEGDEVRLNVDGIDNFEDLLQFATQEHGGVSFDFGNGDELFLGGTRLAALDQDQFTFY